MGTQVSALLLFFKPGQTLFIPFHMHGDIQLLAKRLLWVFSACGQLDQASHPPFPVMCFLWKQQERDERIYRRQPPGLFCFSVSQVCELSLLLWLFKRLLTDLEMLQPKATLS